MLWGGKKVKPKEALECFRDDARDKLRDAGYDLLFQPPSNNELPPNFCDLVLLRDAVVAAKPSLVLEYGSGYSTYVLAKTLQCIGDGRIISIELGAEWRKISADRLPADLAERVTFIAPQPTIRLALSKLPGANPNLWFEKKSKTPRRVGIATISFPEVHGLEPDFIFIDGPDSRQIPGYVDALTDEVLPAVVSDPLVYQSKKSPVICVDSRREQCAILSANLPPDYRAVVHEEQRFTFFYPPDAKV